MRINPIAIEDQTYDLLIIGGGINGAGIARDAAMRGLKVLLLDKGDIASGTTSWSTRLIHGGLRYLEHGEFGHVRESLREREHLLTIAPHLVKPLPLLIPIYDGNRRGKIAIRAGMIAYDLLSFDKSLSRYRMLTPEEATDYAPGLDRTGLRGAAIYYDAQIEYAERLVVENALSAAEHGARILTYARVDEFIVEDNSVRGVRFIDVLSGSSHIARAAFTINVSGPWVDEVLSRAGAGVERQIGGTKGSHIIVERFPGAPKGAMYVEAGEDGRPFFIIPWNNLYLIGTTDSAYDGDLDCVRASEEEIAYLLGETTRVIPSSQLDRNSVLYTYSGVRPLPYVAKGEPASITRRHFVRDHAAVFSGLVSIVGGKLTTYRSLAEQAVDLIFKKLRRDSVACRTASESLPGARCDDYAGFRTHFEAESGLPKNVVERLLKVYGTRANDVLALANDDPELCDQLSNTGAIGAEVVFSFTQEMAETLTDCLMRRTMIGWNAMLGLDAVESAGRVARRFLDWDSERAAREIAEYQRYVARFQPENVSLVC
jgi:glycerol-3-phosphate dehydrogenase